MTEVFRVDLKSKQLNFNGSLFFDDKKLAESVLNTIVGMCEERGVDMKYECHECTVLSKEDVGQQFLNGIMMATQNKTQA